MNNNNNYTKNQYDNKITNQADQQAKEFMDKKVIDSLSVEHRAAIHDYIKAVLSQSPDTVLRKQIALNEYGQLLQNVFQKAIFHREFLEALRQEGVSLSDFPAKSLPSVGIKINYLRQALVSEKIERKRPFQGNETPQESTRNSSGRV